MFFDGHIQAANIEIVEADDHVEFAIVAAFTLNTPAGVVPVPIGILRLPMGREAAIAHGKALHEAGEKLPEQKKSDLVVAQNLAGVDQVVKQQEKLKTK